MSADFRYRETCQWPLRDLDETSRELAGDVGIEVASVFVQGMERIASPTRLVSEIDANNEPNQRLSRWLGFVLVGEPACKDPRFIDILEESRLYPIDEHLQKI